jgi:hypothetical protein
MNGMQIWVELGCADVIWNQEEEEEEEAFTVLIGNSCRARFHGGGGESPFTSFCRNEITTYKLFGISVCSSMVSFTAGKQNQTQKAQLPKSCTG